MVFLKKSFIFIDIGLRTWKSRIPSNMRCFLKGNHRFPSTLGWGSENLGFHQKFVVFLRQSSIFIDFGLQKWKSRIPSQIDDFLKEIIDFHWLWATDVKIKHSIKKILFSCGNHRFSLTLGYGCENRGFHQKIIVFLDEVIDFHWLWATQVKLKDSIKN